MSRYLPFRLLGSGFRQPRTIADPADLDGPLLGQQTGGESSSVRGIFFLGNFPGPQAVVRKEGSTGFRGDPATADITEMW
jgi:hypothetical protein